MVQIVVYCLQTVAIFHLFVRPRDRSKPLRLMTNKSIRIKYKWMQVLTIDHSIKLNQLHRLQELKWIMVEYNILNNKITSYFLQNSIVRSHIIKYLQLIRQGKSYGIRNPLNHQVLTPIPKLITIKRMRILINLLIKEYMIIINNKYVKTNALFQTLKLVNLILISNSN